MKRRNRSGHGLVLFELIISIGFFLLFAAICLRIFFAAYQLSEENRALSGAITAVENAAECLKANIDPVLYYTGEWSPAQKDEAVFYLTIDTQAEQGVKTAHITAAEINGDAIFALTVKSLEETAP